MASTGTHLPTFPPPIIQNHPSIEVRDAYATVQTLEAQERVLPNTKARQEILINLRIVAYFMLYAPSETARVHIAERVLSRPDKDSIVDLGNIYSVCLIGQFKKFSGRTSQQSPIVSRCSYTDIQQMMQRYVVQAPQNHAQAKRSALARDAFRCPVSGIYDPCIKKVANWQDTIDPRYTLYFTECAHIFPESLNTNVAGNSAKISHAASMWTLLESFGFGSIPEELQGANIHRLENVMTLDVRVHGLFDRLHLWFEATGFPNTYDVYCSDDDLFDRSWNRRIVFISPHPESPIPNPTYLAIHATCAKVAHMSGAAEYIDQYSQDLESLMVLSNDGASAKVLEYALQPFSTQIQVG